MSVDIIIESFIVRLLFLRVVIILVIFIYKINVLCVCFIICLKLYFYILWNIYKKLKKCIFFCGELFGVKIYLVFGIYIRFCCIFCK